MMNFTHYFYNLGHSEELEKQAGRKDHTYSRLSKAEAAAMAMGDYGSHGLLYGALGGGLGGYALSGDPTEALSGAAMGAIGGGLAGLVGGELVGLGVGTYLGDSKKVTKNPGLTGADIGSTLGSSLGLPLGPIGVLSGLGLGGVLGLGVGKVLGKSTKKD